jgi:hypothetical protein
MERADATLDEGGVRRRQLVNQSIREKAIREQVICVEAIEMSNSVLIKESPENSFIDSDQAWFWSEHWQYMEREAQADIDAGQLVSFENVDDALAFLEQKVAEYDDESVEYY